MAARSGSSAGEDGWRSRRRRASRCDAAECVNPPEAGSGRRQGLTFSILSIYWQEKTSNDFPEYFRLLSRRLVYTGRKTSTGAPEGGPRATAASSTMTPESASPRGTDYAALTRQRQARPGRRPHGVDRSARFSRVPGWCQ